MALDREEISERVLAIAEVLLNEGGMNNLKARTIAEQAGISVGSVYNLFSDLDGVHRAVNMRLLDRLGGAGAAAMVDLGKRGTTDVRQRLLALAGAYVRFVEAHPGSWPALLAFNRRRAVRTEPDAYEARLDQLFAIHDVFVPACANVPPRSSPLMKTATSSSICWSISSACRRTDLAA